MQIIIRLFTPNRNNPPPISIYSLISEIKTNLDIHDIYIFNQCNKYIYIYIQPLQLYGVCYMLDVLVLATIFLRHGACNIVFSSPVITK